MLKYFLFFILFLSKIILFSQNFVKILRTTEKISIDGKLNETCWQNVPSANHFLQYSPKPGEAASFDTDVRLVYDDNSLYIAAILYDAHPDSILHELTLRDNYSANSDWFSVMFDTYKDGNNGLLFVVTAAGVQTDEKYATRTADKSWNVVWKSERRITEKGWEVEMEIPFSALRFPAVEKQEWKVNFSRNIRRYRQESSWSPILPEINNPVQQCGILSGIENIKSPLRLSATPYLASGLEKTGQNPLSKSLTGGMDIKYGINDAFTLDATLIPDFGQVQFDNKVLNLSPFEVKFDENRPFFTEGTELFNKGNLFYSRRIGGSPYFQGELSAFNSGDVSVKSRPKTNRLLNATKISGRTNRGLGIGFFNAIEAENYAILENTKTLQESKYLLNPLTNYNVIVFDQNLKNNSYFSFINTNVSRRGAAADANVTAIDFTLRNKKNKYLINGIAALSQRFVRSDSTSFGHKINFGLAKISGIWQWSGKYVEESAHYDPNDLGFLYSPNERSFAATLNYGKYKPFGIFNRVTSNITMNYGNLYAPFLYTNFDFFSNTFFLTKKIFAFGTSLAANVAPMRDYFEPRNNDFNYFLERPKNFSISPFVSTDYRKILALDVGFTVNKSSNSQRGFGYYFSPRWRTNDHLSFILRNEINWLFDDIGYVSKKSNSLGFDKIQKNDVIIGTRNRQTITNLASIKYSFTHNMGIDFRFRHYWSKVSYSKFEHLLPKGLLEKTPYAGKDAQNQDLHNTTANFFNIDVVYSWRFAPGSDLFLTYKNSIDAFNAKNDTFLNDFSRLKEGLQTNGVSLKVIYFVDYLYFAKKK